MIKSFYEIKIGDISGMEETGRISQFKKWYNPLPMILFVKQFEKLFKQIYEKLNDKSFDELDKDTELEYILKCDKEYKQLTYLDFTIQLHLDAGTRIKRVLNEMYLLVKKSDQKKLNKIILNNKNLKYALSEVDRLMPGTKIETIEDYNAFKEIYDLKFDRLDNIVRKRKAKPVKEKTSVIKYVSSYLSYLNMSMNGIEEMRLSTFLSLRDFANEKSAKEKDEYDKMNAKNKRNG